MTIAQHPLRVSAIYNPQTQSRTELIQGFVARQKIFKRLFKSIKEAKMDTPEQHYLLLARRGMGKTTLLLRLAYEIENDETLHSWLEPLVFNEEEYGIRRLFNFWERTLELLAARLPDFSFTDVDRRRLSTLYTDDESYERALYDLLLQTLHQSHKKIILFIDNFGDLSRKFSGDEAHRLRKILQTCADIRIFAASAVVLDELYNYGHPFYEFFKVEELKGLDQKETQALLLSLSKHYKQEQVERIVREHPGRVEALRRITGGVIRTMVLLFEIFADDNDGSAFKDLEAVLDRITPLYKHRMDDLSDQQQAIVEAIALHWDGINVKEIADRTRLDSKIISAQLQQLERNGVVEKRPTNTKNHLYLISERFFNIWFLMRLGRRGDEKRVLWLVRFLESWCDDDMMKNRAESHRNALLKGNFDPEAAFAYTQAFAQSQKLSLGDRHELLRDTKTYLADTAPDIAPDLPASQLDEAWKALQEWFEGDKNKAVEYFHALSQVLLSPDEQKEWKKACKNKSEVLFWESKIPYVAFNVRIIFLNLGTPEWDKVEKLLIWGTSMGEISAIGSIGMFYQIINSDLSQAVYWYEKAANLGIIDSMRSLGSLYAEKLNNEKLAIYWYNKAACAGNVQAMYDLGKVYDESINNKVGKAKFWYEKAANAGHTDAMVALAQLYFVQKNTKLSIFWLEKAIDLENIEAMAVLGHLYYSLNNKQLSRHWLEKAAELGNLTALIHVCISNKTDYNNAEKQVIWNEKLTSLLKEFIKLYFGNISLNEAPENITISLFALALAQGLSPWLLNYFLSPEGEAAQLKDRFKPIYYALLKATDHPDYLRMGDELRQTVEEIEVRVQQMMKEYA